MDSSTFAELNPDELNDPQAGNEPRQMRICGNSMRFLLHHGDTILCRWAPPGQLRLGDIVVYFRSRQPDFVAHRLLWKSKRPGGTVLWIKGDGLHYWDPPIPETCIVARVEAYRRGQGRWISLQEGGRWLWQLSIGLISTIYFSRPLPPILNAFRWLGRQLRDRFLRACAWSRDRIADACCYVRDRCLQACAWSRDRIFDAFGLLGAGYRFARDRVLQTGAWSRDRIVDAFGLLGDGCRFAKIRILRATAWSRDRIADLRIRLRGAAIRQALRLLAASYPACSFLPIRESRLLRAGIGQLWLKLCADASAPPPGLNLRWEGEIRLSGTVVVPAGSKLSILPGTVVRMDPAAAGGPVADRLAFGGRAPLPRGGRCALIVYGELDIAGEPGREVRFSGPSWGGLIILGQARASIRHARFDSADDFAILGADFCRAELRHCEFRGGQGATAWGGWAVARLDDCSFSSAGRAAVWSHDDARVRMKGSSISGCRIGVITEGRAVVADARGDHSSCRDTAALALGYSALLARASRWADNAGQSAVCVSGRARLRLRGCRFERNGVALEALQRARARLFGVSGEANGTGLWTQNGSRAEAAGGCWLENREAIHTSHASRASLRGVSLLRQSKAGVMAEEDSRVAVEDGLFSGNENGILALQQSRLQATGNVFSGCRDTAVWVDHRCRTRLADNRFDRNGKDFHREWHPRYDAVPGQASEVAR